MPKEYDSIKDSLKESHPDWDDEKISSVASATFFDVFKITVKDAMELEDKNEWEKWKDEHNFGKSVKDVKKDFNCSLDIQKIDKEKRFIEGYASTEELDRDGEIISKEAFLSSLEEYMKNPIIRYMHEPKPIGKTIEANITEKGLYVKAYISNKTKIGKEAWGLIEDGILKSFSVGGSINKIESFFHIGTNKRVNKITDMSLREISVVDIPANPASFFTVVKGLVNNNEPVAVFNIEQINVGANNMEQEQQTIKSTEVEVNVMQKEEEKIEQPIIKTEEVQSSDKTFLEVINKPEITVIKSSPEEIDNITISKKDYDTLLAKASKVDELENTQKLDELISKKLDEIILEKKQMVTSDKNSLTNFQKNLKEKSLGELAVMSGFFTVKK